MRAVRDPTHETENPPPRPPKSGLPDRAHGTHQESQNQHSYHTNKPIRCVGASKLPLYKFGTSADVALIQKMPKHRCATRGGMVSQDLDEI